MEQGAAHKADIMQKLRRVRVSIKETERINVSELNNIIESIEKTLEKDSVHIVDFENLSDSELLENLMYSNQYGHRVDIDDSEYVEHGTKTSHELVQEMKDKGWFKE
ncbi:hypothetical protein M0L17_11935 [Bacillaceae bacterium OS4b]|nr:hypothetical protein [Bacillaceae bacterium OS4b]